ncbi:MAG: hypothetical protein A3F47_01680 [Candidatus Staskawiczbacteria bacterium RIFCSPHIGHO2_12_FULL_38_11]|uniref:N-acetyltransferase domain-containing protein n=1 Tax=Candidatus Staskawiczbacteria bacterium RIFCSPHIGHO2_12_FULL_38_11 TaxID=1802209 RepID=A0A1G2I656_9BACT|nr:MAG: hypothetical protein A3F47_01680 [Candidatus Staskawiczbacteria bacterium RIFCSPHIGHO2_12_FULL_38_11]
MSLQIRWCRPDDFECLTDFDDHFSQRRADKLRAVRYVHSFTCFVADDEGEIVGFMIMENLHDNSHYMSQINVKKSLQRQGVGTQLVRKVFEIIGAGGHISLCVNTDNYPAIKFYESLGFMVCGFTAGYRRGQDKLWYQIDV